MTTLLNPPGPGVVTVARRPVDYSDRDGSGPVPIVSTLWHVCGPVRPWRVLHVQVEVSCAAGRVGGVESCRISSP